MEEKKAKILDRMRWLCSMREYCTSDIRRKIMNSLQKGGPQTSSVPPAVAASVADELMSSLVKDGYLNDARYASAFARDKSTIAGWGRLKIRNALMLKGIDSDTITEALDTIDTGKASDKMKKSLQLKAKSLASKPDIRLRLLRYAAGRGYSYEETVRILDEILKK